MKFLSHTKPGTLASRHEIKTYWDPEEEEDNHSDESSEEQFPDRDELDLEEDNDLSDPLHREIPAKPRTVKGVENPTWP